MILFANRPETPLIEVLHFLTSVLEKKGGTEQRICLRLAPRCEYQTQIYAEDGIERSIVENKLFGGQDQTFQIPAWPEGSLLTAASAATATTLHLDTTLSDFRVGEKLILIRADDELVETADISAVTSSTITLGAGLANAWPAETEVYPLREAIVPQQVKVKRYATNLTQYTISFHVTKNGTNLATGAALGFDPLGLGPDTDKILLADANGLETTLNEGWNRNIQVVDGNTGAFSAFSYMIHSRRGTSKMFTTTTREALWNVRVLLHYLQGRQKSFALPTFATDLLPTSNMVSGAATLDVANVGLSSYNVLPNASRRYIRVEYADGTSGIALVTAVAAVDAATERITVSANWSRNATPEQISRIAIVEKVRVGTDDVQFSHADLNGTAQVAFPVQAVLE